ncbi:MAG: BamA/TamA family outer membrane protein [Betaproteobacteria bacterium]
MMPKPRAPLYAPLRSARLALGALAMLAMHASAQVVDAPAQAPVPAAAVSASSDAIRYRVDVEAPAEIAQVLGTTVDLIRWQGYTDMTPDLLDALVREAPLQAREAAAAVGYFSAQVTVTLDRAQSPVAVTLRVIAGAPTRVAGVRIAVTGAAVDDAVLGASAIAAVQGGWPLREGQVFTQAAWAAAKQRAVAMLAASPYAAARLASSEARVDPDTARAELQVALDSGPPFYVGDIAIQGLSRYTPELVRNFSTLERGAPYGENAVDDFIRRLLTSGYFASVQANLDTAPEHAADAKLTLSVIEAPPKRLEFGVGYSSDTQFRASASYSDVDIDGKGLQFYANARLETKVQSVDLRLLRPPDAKGWRDSLSGAVERTDIEGLITKTASAIVRRQAIDERNTPAYSAGFYFDEQQPSGGEAVKSHALYVDAQYTWRRTDELLSPTRGWMANFEGGAGIPGVSTKGFGRTVGKAAYWLPFGNDDQLYLRAEGGAVLANSRNGVPSVFLFRTGGDTTVRGYAFESLGVQQDNAVVGGRYYAVGSAEVTHWFAPAWGVAAFVDAGNATDSLTSFPFKVGYGIGARLRTPIGPFRLDLAYGEATRQVRLHFSVGLSF